MSLEINKNKYLYNGKEIQNDVLSGTEYGYHDYGVRLFDPTIIKFNKIDRFSEKYYNLSPCQYVNNNPIVNIDINGDTIFVSRTGHILRNDEADNLVYMNDYGNLTYLGELGGTIDINFIYTNLLRQNMLEAKYNMWNPFSFRNSVKDNARWDFKNRKEHIFGLGNDGKTSFLFQEGLMDSQDIGNHHFGAVALAYGLFPSEEFILRQAGQAQINSETSKPEWQKYEDSGSGYIPFNGGIMRSKLRNYCLRMEMIPVIKIG